MHSIFQRPRDLKLGARDDRNFPRVPVCKRRFDFGTFNFEQPEQVGNSHVGTPDRDDCAVLHARVNAVGL